VVGQVVLFRELIVLFNGNELSVGIMLATWLLWTAAGSILTGWLLKNRTDTSNIIAIVECLCGLSLPLTTGSMRVAGTLLRTAPDEQLGIVPMLSISFSCLGVFCVLSGSLFILAVQMYRQTCAGSDRLATSYAYLLETAGSGLGGILTSILLLRFFGSFQIAIIVLVLNVSLAVCLLFNMRHARVAITFTSAAILAVPLVVYVAPRLEDITQQRLWRGFQVLESQDTIYGRLTVVEAGGLRSIYDNGSILANVPDPAAAEEAVHYALLEHPAPQKVLLIGGGVNGSVVEALKHPMLERLDYVELDPALIAVFRRLFPRESALALFDPRVHVHFADGRHYLMTTSDRFDAIILNVPNPDTAQLNRFYTSEFFRSAHDHLAPGGLLALQLRSSEEYIGPELAEFLRCIHGTLQGVFPYIAVIPGETLHLFGSSQPGALTDDPQVLIARLRSRNLKTLYVREYFLPYRMSPERMSQINDLLRPLPETRINRDFQPVAYYFGAVLWSAQFKSGYAHLLESAGRIRFRDALGGVIAVLILLVLVLIRMPAMRARARITALWSVAATGYSLMALQILLLLAFQSLYGYVYKEFAMTIGMFMAGIALGSWFGIERTRAVDQASLARAAAWNQVRLAISAPLLLLLMNLLARSSAESNSLWITQLAFPALALLCGVPGGYQFPVAAGIYLRGNETRSGSGTLYALDLIGGCAGALLLAGVLIPVFGFWNVAWLTLAVNIAPALLFVRTNHDSSAN
jgi:spermidine synthase